MEGAGKDVQPEGKEEANEEHKPGSKEEAKENECPATFGPIITDTAVPLEKGKFAVQPTFGLGFVTNSLTQSWRRVSAGGNFKTFGMDWKFTYGLIKNMEVFVVVPYVHNWANSVKEPGPNGERSASFGGLGDVNLTMKYQTAGRGTQEPHGDRALRHRIPHRPLPPPQSRTVGYGPSWEGGPMPSPPA